MTNPAFWIHRGCVQYTTLQNMWQWLHCGCDSPYTERIITMQIGSREHFTKIYNDLKAKQTVQEWLDECPTTVETEFENGRYYIIRVDKREKDAE